MNAFLFLGLLLLAVPMQLLLNHVIKSSEVGASLQENAFDRISDKVESLYDDIHSTVKYYSKLSHLKELFVIPHKRKEAKKKKIKESVRTFVDPATGMQVTTIVMGSGYDDDEDDDGKRDGTKTKSRGSVANMEPGRSGSSQRSAVGEGVSQAREVEEWNKKHLYYARSEKIREVHPPNVMFSVGEVVEHVQDHYDGVIIGWDEKCQATDEWLKNHGYLRKSAKGLKDSPHYLVLVKQSEASKSELYYIPQKHLEAKDDVELDYQDLYHYFESYSKEEQKFVPRAWLKDRYPKG